MDILETFYDSNFHFKTNPRKEQIDFKYTQIIAPHSCGTTYFVFDYLNTHFKPKEYLYIDCSDIRVSKLLTSDLIDFISSNSIEIVVFDNYSLGFDIDFKSLKNTISNIIITANKRLEIDEFFTIYFTPLDFEQFLLFGNFEDSKVAFNYFLKYGNFPISSHLEEHKQIPTLQTTIKSNINDETKLHIQTLVYQYISQQRSLLELFTKAKESIKISKDKFYSYIKYLEETKEIYLVANYFKPKATKKIFLYNPALFGAVSVAKKFKNLLTNYIFLELKYRFEDIYHLDDVDFYIPSQNLIVICMPFVTPALISQKSSKIIKIIQENKLEISNIQIVTNSTEDSMFIDEVEAQIVPFYTWALSF